MKEAEPLVRLENADLRAAAAQAEAAVALAQAQLDQLLAGTRPEEIAAAEARYRAAQAAVGQALAQRNNATPGSLSAAETQLDDAKERQQELQRAYDGILANPEQVAAETLAETQLKLNAATEAVAQAQALVDLFNAGVNAPTLQAYNSALGAAVYQRDAAQAQLDLLKAGATPEQVAAARAQLDQAKAALAAAQAQLEQAALKAPFTGIVVSLNTEVGEVVGPSAPVLVLVDASRWRMQTNDLSETDVVLVRPGQGATVTLDAFPDQTFQGAVTEIASVAETNRGNTTYAVTIDLDPTQAALRWGMTAFVDIEVEP